MPYHYYDTIPMLKLHLVILNKLQTYCLLGFDFSFTMWMDIRAELREIISKGMKTFNWDVRPDINMNGH